MNLTLEMVSLASISLLNSSTLLSLHKNPHVVIHEPHTQNHFPGFDLAFKITNSYFSLQKILTLLTVNLKLEDHFLVLDVAFKILNSYFT